ncbi:MAG TPA: hypothetical protein VGM13_10190 [Thermoanaerobaculia bacterium]
MKVSCRFLDAALGALAAGGVAVVAVPPITTEVVLEENRGIHYHRSNFTLSEWSALLARFRWSVTLYHHRFAGTGPLPDFTSPFPSARSASDWALVEGSVDGAYCDRRLRIPAHRPCGPDVVRLLDDQSAARVEP